MSTLDEWKRDLISAERQLHEEMDDRKKESIRIRIRQIKAYIEQLKAIKK